MIQSLLQSAVQCDCLNIYVCVLVCGLSAICQVFLHLNIVFLSHLKVSSFKSHIRISLSVECVVVCIQGLDIALIFAHVIIIDDAL